MFSFPLYSGASDCRAPNVVGGRIPLLGSRIQGDMHIGASGKDPLPDSWLTSDMVGLTATSSITQ